VVSTSIINIINIDKLSMIFPGQYRWEILLLAKQSAPKLQAKKGNPQNDFLMVVMPNNIACGYNMAAILQIIG